VLQELEPLIEERQSSQQLQPQAQAESKSGPMSGDDLVSTVLRSKLFTPKSPPRAPVAMLGSLTMRGTKRKVSIKFVDESIPLRHKQSSIMRSGENGHIHPDRRVMLGLDVEAVQASSKTQPQSFSESTERQVELPHELRSLPSIPAPTFEDVVKLLRWPCLRNLALGTPDYGFLKCQPHLTRDHGITNIAFFGFGIHPRVPSTPGQHGVLYSILKGKEIPDDVGVFPLFVSYGRVKMFYAGHYIQYGLPRKLNSEELKLHSPPKLRERWQKSVWGSAGKHEEQRKEEDQRRKAISVLVEEGICKDILECEQLRDVRNLVDKAEEGQLPVWMIYLQCLKFAKDFYEAVCGECCSQRKR
jgi:hypothetical protein